MSILSPKSLEDDSILPFGADAPLKGYQRTYLRAMAHALKPVLLIGQQGVTGAVCKELAEALDRHELVKIKFVACKQKHDKQRMAEELKVAVGAHLVGMVGHMAIFFRSNPDPEKRKIHPPQKSPGGSEKDPIPL